MHFRDTCNYIRTHIYRRLIWFSGFFFFFFGRIFFKLKLDLVVWLGAGKDWTEIGALDFSALRCWIYAYGLVEVLIVEFCYSSLIFLAVHLLDLAWISSDFNFRYCVVKLGWCFYDLVYYLVLIRLVRRFCRILE